MAEARGLLRRFVEGQQRKRLSLRATIKRNGYRNSRLARKRVHTMTQWNQSTVRPHMKVYTSDAEHVGHIAEVYEDSFLLHRGYFFPVDRYIPYSAIRSEERRVGKECRSR